MDEGSVKLLFVLVALVESVLAIGLVLCWAKTCRKPPVDQDFAAASELAAEDGNEERRDRSQIGEKASLKHYDEASIERALPAVIACESAPACVVCLHAIDPGEKVRWLHCAHVLHADCVAQWWTHQPRRWLECPVCRCPQDRGEELSSRSLGLRAQGAVASALADPEPVPESFEVPGALPMATWSARNAEYTATRQAVPDELAEEELLSMHSVNEDNPSQRLPQAHGDFGPEVFEDTVSEELV